MTPSIPTPGKWISAAAADSLAPGQCRSVVAAGHQFCLVRLDDGFHALDNLCLHQAGPLCEGHIDGHDTVTCPWHGWSYAIRSGCLEQDPKIGVSRHDALVVDGEVQVRLTE